MQIPPFSFLLFLVPGLALAQVTLTPGQIAKAGIATTSVTALAGGGDIRLPAQVVVPPGQIEVIAASLPTMISAVKVAYGETVKKGQVLLRLQGGQLLEAQRDLATAQAQAQLATERRQRDEALFADGIIAQGRLSEARANEVQARALYAEKRGLLRQAGASSPGKDGTFSGTAELRAPFDAVVLEANAQPGQRVDAQTSLLKLGRLAPLWLEMQASQNQASQLAPGDLVAVPGCTAPARIALIAPHLQAASQSLLIRAELAQPAGCVKPFQYVQVTVSPGRAPAGGTLQAPIAAIARHEGKAWVFVATPEGFRPVGVEVLEESAATVTVTGDIPVGASIATKGVSAIKSVWLGLGSE